MHNIRKYLGILLVAGGIFGLLYLNSHSDSQKTVTTMDIVLKTTTTKVTTDTVVVNIKGAIRYPGMYEVPSNLRIGDLIAIAGGVTEEADIEAINLADKLEDEMEVVVPKIMVITHRITTMPLTTTDTSDVNTTNITSTIRILTVEIAGAVTNPGIYKLEEGARVDDLINAAGGLEIHADTSEIELARLLVDGEKVVVPENVITTTVIKMIYVKITGEVVKPDIYYVEDTTTLKELVDMAGGVTESADITRIEWDTELCLGAVIDIPRLADENTNTYSEYDDHGRININYASVETLILLPGIGDILAQRIVDYRSEYGNFLTIEDIMLVSGIKTSVYDQIKELITV